MTGFVFAVLNHLGMIEASRLRARSMGELNQLAVEVLLILGRTLYGERLTRLRTAGYLALRAAGKADTGEDPDEVARCIAEFRRLSEEYNNLFATKRERATRAIEILFSI